MSIKVRAPIGQILLDRDLITKKQLNAALSQQRDSGHLLGESLVKLGYIDQESTILPLIAEQIGVKYVYLPDYEIPQDIIAKIPAKIASFYNIIPVSLENNKLTIASVQPLDIQSQDEISSLIDEPLTFVLSGKREIQDAIKHYFGVGAETIERMMGSIETDKSRGSEVDNIDEIDSEASISNFLNQILHEAYQNRATDIHVEPYEDKLKVRYRVDGILYDAKVPRNIKFFKDSINSRIKILSSLNIAEKRNPQDGRFKVRVEGIDIDLRVSFLPTPYGESVVLRLLNTNQLYDFKKLGLASFEHEILNGLIERPHGIIFLTGPTGSGKTTTLYSCLSKINSEDKKIITIEDPIEYQLEGITQVQINSATGLTFAKGLRSMLRHDPDIMMVGEVRDAETAEIATQVALTGHLVFSTLHTNDAASGIARLLDMGVEPYLITSTVECFIAQRLVRVVCPHCKTESPEPSSMIQEFQKESQKSADIAIFFGEGCESCHFTGYSGREAIYEFLMMDSAIRNLIMEGAGSEAIKNKAKANGMKTLRQNGWLKIKQGITTPQEVIRVTQDK